MPVGAVLAVGSVLAVSAFQNRKIVQVQPYFIADIAPLQDIFAYAKFRRFSVCTVRSVLSGRAFYIGDRHKVLPLAALVTPLDVGFGSLHFYIFGVHAVLAVDAIFTVDTVLPICAVNAVHTIFSVRTVYSVLTVGAILAVDAVFTVDTVLPVCAVNAVHTIFAVRTVYSVLTVGAVRAVFTVCAVLSVFSGSTRKFGKRHKVAPIGFISVFPLNRRAVVPHLRQFCVGFCRLAPSYGKHDAKHQQSGTKRQKRTCESFLSCFHLLTSVQNSKMGAKSARTAPGQFF